MNHDELQKNLVYLIDKYIDSKSKKQKLISEVSVRGFSQAKYILHELVNNEVAISIDDSSLIKEITFNYV